MLMRVPFNGVIYISSCDKGVLAHLIVASRNNILCVLITGGVMEAGPNFLTLEQIGAYSARLQRGEITQKKFTFAKQHACPSCGPVHL